MSVKIMLGDVRDKLRELPDESVHCVVTSPPYFGLRDYGVAGQIGLEPTPAEFVAVMVDVFREVRRVLRKDGTLWLNLGDSYSSGGRADYGSFDPESKQATHASIKSAPRAAMPVGIKPKDLLGIPWRVAFALQADGWYLRQDIIWAKPNPMPESVTDRCTKSHEYMFLLSKSARYFYDAEAIAEDAVHDVIGTGRGGSLARVGHDAFVSGEAHKGDPWTSNGTRNRRSVWTVATKPFKEAHFATFPPDLIEPCIKAGCPKDCCAKCGAPVVRMQSRTGPDGETIVTAASDRHAKKADGSPIMGNNGYAPPDALERGSFGAKNGLVAKEAAGWSPSCSCDAGTVRGTVLDPFGGAGTTGLVADRLQRDAILIELNPEYAAIARRWIEGDAPLFTDIDIHSILTT